MVKNVPLIVVHVEPEFGGAELVVPAVREQAKGRTCVEVLVDGPESKPYLGRVWGRRVVAPGGIWEPPRPYPATVEMAGGYLNACLENAALCLADSGTKVIVLRPECVYYTSRRTLADQMKTWTTEADREKWVRMTFEDFADGRWELAGWSATCVTLVRKEHE